jgi:P27 family predicted phage terminase small subunit
MRGRKPIPTAIKKLRGNPGKRKLAQELAPITPAAATDLSVPQPPKWLNDMPHALERWRTVAPLLDRMGLLSHLDLDAFEAYCVVWARWRQAEEAIAKHGPVTRTPKGYVVQSPLIGIANKALQHVRAYEVEFGMTPSARSRVSAHQKPTKSKAQEFMESAPKLRRVK